MNEVSLSVLGYIEDGDWIAHALEMDLIGVGDSFENAVEALRACVVSQISFAMQENDPSLIFHDAPVDKFMAFQKAKDVSLFRQVAHRHVEENMDDVRASVLNLPDPEPLEYATA